MGEANALNVFLLRPKGERVLVGTIRLLPGGRDATEFRLARAYVDDVERPVLGQVFEDDLGAVHKARVRLPAFFSNLLPEGILRELLARRAGVSPTREFFLLAQLGRDLPGAVVVEPDGPLTAEGELADELPAPSPTLDHPLRFSVAGLQLKFSVQERAGRWVLPVSGEGGHWLLKVPHPDFKGVPLNEFSMMEWARRVAIDVPAVKLVPLASVEGLPAELVFTEPQALLVKRFDRDGERRVHVEDFLQVLNRHPDERAKYRATSYDTLGRILLSLANGGTADVRELVRRLVFNAAIGNGDAHLKNWSLLYADPRWPRLAPAYDLVSTVHYLPSEPGAALNVARTKRYEDLTLGVFTAFARHIGVEERLMTEWVEEAARAIRASWPDVRAALPIDAALAATIDRQLKRVPVLGAV